MTGATAPRGRSYRAPASTASRVRALDPAELAWLAALPCAALTALLAALLGPPLGHAFLGPGHELFLAPVARHLEPVEHGRYLVALLGPVLLAVVLVLAAHRPLRLLPAVTRATVVATQLALLAFAALCIAAQHDVLLSADIAFVEHTEYFTWATLAAALALALLAPVLLRARGVHDRVRAALRETPARRVACLAAAALFTALWLLSAVNTDGSIGNANAGVSGHLLWSMDEAFAILDGRTPLVDFHAQYGQLWPYPVAIVMALFGSSIGVYTIAMTTISGLALVAVYATFRRLVKRSLPALALFLPFVATGFFMQLGPAENRYAPSAFFSVWPVRYAGPYLLAWLLARHADRAVPRRAWPLFLAGGLVVLNNVEFGVPAFAATLVALVCIRPPRSRGAAARLLGAVAAGLAAALALVSLLTLARAGTLPHLGLLLEFSRHYGIGGWELLPLPRIGLYLVFYVTFAAATAVAVVRAVRGAAPPALTAMLAWSGAFGLLAGSYFVGRSHPQVLIDLFSTWALALALLAIVAARSLAAREWRRPGLAELAVLFGFGLTVCSLPQFPAPWWQIQRLGDVTPVPAFKQRDATRFVAAHTRRGERVGILISLSHRIAYDLGLANVAPYASIESMPTLEQERITVHALRGAHARKLFLSTKFTFNEEIAAFVREGFAIRHVQRGSLEGIMVELVDRSHGR